MRTSSADAGAPLQPERHDDAPVQLAGDAPAPAAPTTSDVTESEITANVPKEQRAEVERLAEQVRQRAADAKLFEAVAAAKFTGKRWQGLSDDLGGYALAVTDAWLNTGYIFAKTTKMGRPVVPTETERRQLQSDSGLRHQLANGLVGAALVQFRDRALKDTGWRPDGGASLDLSHRWMRAVVQQRVSQVAGLGETVADKRVRGAGRSPCSGKRWNRPAPDGSVRCSGEGHDRWR